jgi:2-amino-4-hydroxy-6-hydroxymethyldihydropteridine diphosphokinase
MTSLAYLLTGSNLGDRIGHLASAAGLLNAMAGEIVKYSPVYESPPWGFDHPTAFLNQAIALKTSVKPADLLAIIHDIEKSSGRRRGEGNTYEARTLDIDIIFYGQEIIGEHDLQIPHPRMHLRRFTLLPLCDIAPGLVHPLLKKNMRELLDDCSDDSDVSCYTTDLSLRGKEVGGAL